MRRVGRKRTDRSAADNGHLALFLLRRHGGQGGCWVVGGSVVSRRRSNGSAGVLVMLGVKAASMRYAW